jgi:hypothetical protein
VGFDRAAAPHYFTQGELSSLPPTPEERAAAVKAVVAAGGDGEAVAAAGKAQCHVRWEEGLGRVMCVCVGRGGEDVLFGGFVEGVVGEGTQEDGG